MHLVTRSQKCCHVATLHCCDWFRYIFENLYAKCVFLHTARHFQESKSDAGILFMKIQVGIVHFVTRAHKLCYKAALHWPFKYAIKKCTFWNHFEYLYAKYVVLLLQLDVFERVRAVRVFC